MTGWWLLGRKRQKRKERAGLKTRHYNGRPEGRRYESKWPLPENGGHRANPPITRLAFPRAWFPEWVLGGGGDEMDAEMGREHGRFLDLGEGRLNNGKA
jgi:hypothetical protein